MDTSILVISGLVSLLSVLILYTLFVPKGNRTFNPNNEEQAAKKPMLRLMNVLGNDFYKALPAGMVANRRNRVHPQIKTLLIKSGNPWGLRPDEFIFMQYLSGIIGFVAGWFLWVATTPFTGLAWWIVVPLVTLFGFFFPRIRYRDEAKRRDLEFKRELPEALDLLIISLSGGRTFAQSLREIIPTMEESVLKEEFRTMVKGMDTGKTLDEVLDNFATRAPNESIISFIRAIQSAVAVNSPMVETLANQVDASRQEFFALIHQKTGQLESKIFIALTPTLMPALLIVVLAPSLFSMLGTLGS